MQTDGVTTAAPACRAKGPRRRRCPTPSSCRPRPAASRTTVRSMPETRACLVGDLMATSTRYLVTGATGQVGFPVALALAERRATTSSPSPASATPASARPLDRGRGRVRRSRPRQGRPRRGPGRRRLRLQLRGREVEPVGRRPRGQRRGRRSAHGALPLRTRVPALLVDRRLRSRDGEPQLETDPLGDNHRVMMPTYSISKIAAEAVVRTTLPHLRRADDDRAAERPLRRQRRLARVPPRADPRRASRCRCTRTVRAGSTRSTRTTSSR